VVHGGLEYTAPVRLDATVLAERWKFVPLMPLHQPHNLAPIRLLLERAPHLPQVACFDTSFHRSNPEVAQMFACPGAPRAGRAPLRIPRLSYEYVASVLPDHDPVAASGRPSSCISETVPACARSMRAAASRRRWASPPSRDCRWGPVRESGSRRAALPDGRTRNGRRAIEKLIYTQSGLLGVSGISGDMRTLLESDEPRARLAIDLFVYRIRREMGSLAAALGGLDAIVFTGGIGEKAAPIRADVCRDAAWLGVELDEAANRRGDRRISTTQSRVHAWVIPTNEELMIARHTRRLLVESR
jgi:acetate kinase